MDKSAMPKAFVNHHSWYSSIIASLDLANPITLEDKHHLSSPSIIYTYDNVFYGFSALLSLDELATLKNFPGFMSSYEDSVVIPATTSTHEFLSLNNFPGLWPTANYGKDVIFGVVDSGVWPESLSFKDDGITTKAPDKWSAALWRGSCQVGQDFNSSMCNKKLIGAKYFYKGLLAMKNINGVSMESARDTKGHGTMISSIAAGNYVKGASYFGCAKGTSKGIAPYARVATYKVLWAEGCFSSDLVQVIDDAVADGVDVISLSLVFAIDKRQIPALYLDAIAIALFNAMANGILVSCAAGNDGLSLGTLQNGLPWVLTTTANSTDRWFAGTITLGNGETITGWSTFPENSSIEESPLIYDKTISNCDSPKLLSTAPKGIIICLLGSVFGQLSNVTSSNVTGAINIVAENPQVSRILCPCIVIGLKSASRLMEYVESNKKPNAKMTFKQTFGDIKPTPVVASDASRGPSLSYSSILKPDVMAPGSMILAAFRGQFDFTSGMSFACAFVSGIAALLKAAHPEWSPAAYVKHDALK